MLCILTSRPPWLCPIRFTFGLPLIATIVSIWSISSSPRTSLDSACVTVVT